MNPNSIPMENNNIPITPIIPKNTETNINKGSIVTNDGSVVIKYNEPERPYNEIVIASGTVINKDNTLSKVFILYSSPFQ